MRKMSFLLGAGVGYVLGTRAGQEQYTKIQAFAKKTADSPQVQQVVEKATETADKVTGMAGEKISSITGHGDKSAEDVRPPTAAVPVGSCASNGRAATTAM